MQWAVAVILEGEADREGGYAPFGCLSRLPGASTSPPPFRNGALSYTLARV